MKSPDLIEIDESTRKMIESLLRNVSTTIKSLLREYGSENVPIHEVQEQIMSTIESVVSPEIRSVIQDFVKNEVLHVVDNEHLLQSPIDEDLIRHLAGKHQGRATRLLRVLWNITNYNKIFRRDMYITTNQDALDLRTVYLKPRNYARSARSSIGGVTNFGKVSFQLLEAYLKELKII